MLKELERYMHSLPASKLQAYKGRAIHLKTCVRLLNISLDLKLENNNYLLTFTMNPKDDRVNDNPKESEMIKFENGNHLLTSRMNQGQWTCIKNQR